MDSSRPAATNRQKIPNLDAFHFFASVLVVLVHYEVIFGQAVIYGTFATTAVSWFFVVSGFILSYTYPSLDSAEDYRRFYLHQVIRIYPVYFLAIVVSSLFVSLNYAAMGDAFFAEVNRPSS
ncbi:MAG: acyltransferase family protein [Gammaproteobacteria bacterium]|jgi:peptidoglycan/LPS O-acetylase OafA/YrhL|nr:acyltransferase family protein [Gammaproteobacteria bacterium]MDP6731395.1 acyltransferase family protein [Gammaproteobacteria bacterium]|tara:strand:- start:704 stop:1069 length:366 start_codon:yes stop_codon:yes gene_type:complete